ncbi:hypothetical protein [Hippea maritima]|uniref:CARDB domain-containing protein n=1 Tax=Hippea maritima (strain ATCC 700847 / DSM 10411 / MH2) TaxID=760142 RepID=F2LVP5_HIPMA|nr:hypothetical protein [Hippea maritima]AEA33829.1 hypothetical protein Hipma_0859 [Hippea maritima DSM 10411]
MRLKSRWIFVILVIVLFNFSAYGAKILFKGNINKNSPKIHKIVKVDIISLRLQKHKTGSFNYVMYIKWKNAGTVNLVGSYLYIKVYMYQNGRKLYLNGHTLPGQTIAPDSIAGDALPLKIVCENKMTNNLTHFSNPTTRDFLVEFVYNSKIIAFKKLLRQSVCKKNTSQFKQGPVGAYPKTNSKLVKYKLLPDLTVKDIAIDKNCRIWVTIKNNGPGSLPNYNTKAGQALIKFYVGSKNNGYRLSYIDRNKKLSKPNGTLRITPPGSLGTIPLYQSKKVTVIVDAFVNRIQETNENNNKMTKKLRCFPGQTKPAPGKKSINSVKYIPADTKPPNTVFKISNISTHLSSGGHIEIQVSFNLPPNMFSIVDGLKIYTTRSEANNLVKDTLLRGSVSRVNSKTIKWRSSAGNICNTQEPCTVYIGYDYHIKDIWGRSLDANRNGMPGGSGGNFWYITGSGKP